MLTLELDAYIVLSYSFEHVVALADVNQLTADADGIDSSMLIFLIIALSFQVLIHVLSISLPWHISPPLLLPSGSRDLT